MYKFNDQVSKAAIEERLTEYQIYKYYYPKLEIGKVVVSPLRHERNASFGIFKARNGKIKFNDLANQDSGDVYSFVQKMFGLSFNDALHKINIDFGLNLLPNRKSKVTLTKTQGIIVQDVDVPDKHKLRITVIPRKWGEIDKKFWNKFGLSIEEVKASNTIPIVAYRIDNGTTIITDKLAYCLNFYDDGDGIMMRKIYQPYNKENKWRTNLTPLVVDGIKELPKSGKLLIITKSRKDRLVLKHFGYAAIAVNSESTFIPEKVFEKLKARFTSIILFFDSDAAGKKNSDILSYRYGIPKIEIPDSWNVTDVAEFRDKYGEGNTRNVLKAITNGKT